MYCMLLRELLICHQSEYDPDQTLTLQNYDSICWINGKFLLAAETYFIYLNVIPVSLVFTGSQKVRFSAISCMTSQSARLKSVSLLKCSTWFNIHIQVTAVSKPSWWSTSLLTVHFIMNPSVFLGNLVCSSVFSISNGKQRKLSWEPGHWACKKLNIRLFCQTWTYRVRYSPWYILPRRIYLLQAAF